MLQKEPTSPSLCPQISKPAVEVTGAGVLSSVRDRLWGGLCAGPPSLPVLLDAKGTPLTPSLHPSDGLLQRCLGRALLRCCFVFSVASGRFSLDLSCVSPAPLADWDECADSLGHDCSPAAQCINLEGSYTCRCRTSRDAHPSRAGRACEGALSSRGPDILYPF